MTRRTTIKEVAQRAGVSYQTVSKLLNGQAQVSNETEQRIMAAIRELDYHPNYTARSLRSQRSRTIGYSWAPAPQDETNTILDTFLQSMFHAAETQGYYLLCFPWHSDPRRQIESYRELVDSGRVDAFVLSSIEYNDPRVQFLQQRRFPFVAFGRSNPEMNFPYIDVDGGYGLRLVVEHLLSLGHRRIAALAWPEDSRVGNNRMEGFAAALAEAGVPLDPGLVLRGEGRYEFGYHAGRELIDLAASERPTAVVTLNDVMAVGVLHAARDCGLQVGRDLAVTGFDDTPVARFLTPSLTSVRQPVWEIGSRLIDMLLDILETGAPPEPPEILVNPELVVRASTVPTAAQTVFTKIND